MEFLSKEQILAAATSSERPHEVVDVPELGGKIVVQGMSGMERDAWERSLIVGRGKRRDVNTENVRAKLTVRSIVDKPGGTRMFSDGEAAVIGRLRVDVLNRIYEAAQRVNGVSDEDIDELKKSSESGDGNASSSN